MASSDQRSAAQGGLRGDQILAKARQPKIRRTVTHHSQDQHASHEQTDNQTPLAPNPAHLWMGINSRS
ncbi:hypothetical protein [uncultured Paracoccus sp.]|uniref:hypothetical protein n=1 Tax=uncultured Paracoccus sp. TaxID=189685 RepID=UPI00261A835E|nr:hypothetical protein [uncultured Paracoccus sp.]